MTEETKTLDYTPELFADVMADYLDYWQLGETVCGAEDAAVILLGDSFKTRRPELAQYSVCRVLDRYVSPWKSDTYLEFSNRDITGEEYQAADDLTGD